MISAVNPCALSSAVVAIPPSRAMRAGRATPPSCARHRCPPQISHLLVDIPASQRLWRMRARVRGRPISRRPISPIVPAPATTFNSFTVFSTLVGVC
jgi:hypothetical protein